MTGSDSAYDLWAACFWQPGKPGEDGAPGCSRKRRRFAALHGRDPLLSLG